MTRLKCKRLNQAGLFNRLDGNCQIVMRLFSALLVAGCPCCRLPWWRCLWCTGWFISRRPDAVGRSIDRHRDVIHPFRRQHLSRRLPSRGQTSRSPQTGGYESGLFYEYGAESINGIRATHQASVWMSDYGDFSLIAVTGEPGFLPHQRATPFSHEHESSRPESYSVALPRYGLQFEVAPTSRAAVLQI
jgi:hypothetical protein